MRRIIFVLILLVGALAEAQWVINAPGATSPGSKLWSGILDPGRAKDWTSNGVRGGIPFYTQICATVPPTGIPNWQPNTNYAAGAQVADSNGNIEQAQNTGTSMLGHPAWATTANGVTTDGGAAWQFNQTGTSQTLVWLPNQQWNTSNLGYLIADSNGNTQSLTQIGTSQSDRPAWTTTTTPDNNITWQVTAGLTDTTAINNALASTACANQSVGQVVQLTAATYYLSAGLTFSYSNSATISNVVLRGQGPDKTKLIFGGLGPCLHDVCIYGTQAWTGQYSGTSNRGGGATWTGTTVNGSYYRGDQQIILGNITTVGSNAIPPSKGNLIFLDQRNDEVGICPKFTGVTNPTGVGNCLGKDGASEVGNLVTIHTGLRHGFLQNDCVGVASVGAPNGNESSIPTAQRGYNSSVNYNTCNNLVGFFQVNVLDGYTFTYTIAQTGLTPDGGGRTGKDLGGLMVQDLYGTTMNAYAPPSGRVCPPLTTLTPNPACDNNNELGMTMANYRTQTEIKKLTSNAIPSGTGTCPAGLPVGTDGKQYVCYTIDEPITMPNWRNSQAPGAWWPGPLSTMDGIEDLSMDFMADGGSKPTNGIRFHNVTDCWVKNVRIMNVNRDAIGLMNSSHISVVDNYFVGTKGAHSESYMMENYVTNNNLMQNNFCQHAVSCIMVGQDMGSVWAYNYAEDSAYYTFTWLMPMLTRNHDFGQISLFESNDIPYQAADVFHGTGSLQTGFRERIRGQDTPLKTQNLVASTDDAFNRGFQWIGEILGSLNSTGASYQPLYQRVDQRLPSSVIWGPGQQNPAQSGNLVYVDNIVLQTMLRWGNYDTATGTVRWCGTGLESSMDCGCGGATSCAVQAEIPKQSFNYLPANFVPATHSLPPSFYLAARPAFWTNSSWGTPPWPAIGPDVTGGTAPDGVGGYSFSIPSQLCYINSPIDPAYQHTFTVTGATFTSGTVTLTLNNTTPAGMVTFPSDVVKVNGIVSATSPYTGFNGTYQVTSASGTQIQYVNQPNTDPGLYQSGGTVTSPNYRLFNGRTCYPDDFH